MLTVGAVFLKRPKLLPNDFPGKRKAFYRAERTLLLPLGLWLLFVFFGAAQLPLPKRRDLVEPMHLRRHEYAPRVHHEYRGTEDISTHVFHFAGREAFVSVLVGQHFFKPIFARCAAALCVCAADAFLPGRRCFSGAHLFWQRWLRDKAKTALAEILFFAKRRLRLCVFLPESAKRNR